MKPPTLHRAGVGLDGLNIQGCAIVAWVLAAIPLKSPVAPGATLLKPALLFMSNQVITIVAVAREFVSNWTEPAKLMFSLYWRSLSLLTKQSATDKADREHG